MRNLLGWLETRLAQNTSNYLKLHRTTLTQTTTCARTTYRGVRKVNKREHTINTVINKEHKQEQQQDKTSNVTCDPLPWDPLSSP